MPIVWQFSFSSRPTSGLLDCFSLSVTPATLFYPTSSSFFSHRNDIMQFAVFPTLAKLCHTHAHIPQSHAQRNQHLLSNAPSSDVQPLLQDLCFNNFNFIPSAKGWLLLSVIAILMIILEFSFYVFSYVVNNILGH